MKRIDECHSFNIHIAAVVGIEKAIILKDLYGWCMLNKQNGRNIHGGRPWSYNSSAALSEKYPYMPPRSIRRWMDELERDKWIESGNFNQTGFDRTKWYSIDFEKYDNSIIAAIGHFGQSNGQSDQWNGQNGQPYHLIPSPSNEVYSPVEEITPLHIEVITHLNSEAGTKYRPTSAKTKKAISARVAEGYTLDDFRAVIEDRVYRWKGDEKMSEYLRPETLFGPKFEGYLQAAQKADKPNADKALNDCEMTPQEEAGYAEYIKFIHANYMNLYRSECKVLSKADWRNYKGCLTHRGIATALTEQERRQLLARVHDKLNADANFRAKNKSVMDCYLSNARAIANRQTTTV